MAKAMALMLFPITWPLWMGMKTLIHGYLPRSTRRQTLNKTSVLHGGHRSACLPLLHVVRASIGRTSLAAQTPVPASHGVKPTRSSMDAATTSLRMSSAPRHSVAAQALARCLL